MSELDREIKRAEIALLDMEHRVHARAYAQGVADTLAKVRREIEMRGDHDESTEAILRLLDRLAGKQEGDA